MNKCVQCEKVIGDHVQNCPRCTELLEFWEFVQDLSSVGDDIDDWFLEKPKAISKVRALSEVIRSKLSTILMMR